MCFRTVILIGVFWPLFATAENDVSPENFNNVATISEGKQSLREFELPYEIFTGLQRKDYGDLRIINAQDQTVPFTLSKRTLPAKHNKILQPLNYYRLAATNSANPVQLRFNLNNNSSISISGSNTGRTGKEVILIIENYKGMAKHS